MPNEIKESALVTAPSTRIVYKVTGDSRVRRGNGQLFDTWELALKYAGRLSEEYPLAGIWIEKIETTRIQIFEKV